MMWLVINFLLSIPLLLFIPKEDKFSKWIWMLVFSTWWSPLLGFPLYLWFRKDHGSCNGRKDDFVAYNPDLFQ
jgi:hypothetical protein